MHQPTNQMQDTLFNNKQMLIYRDVHKSIRSLKYFSMVPYLKACLHFQISTSNSLQILTVHLFFTQIWVSENIVKPVWCVHQILEASWIGVQDCQMCVGNMCTSKVWNKHLKYLKKNITSYHITWLNIQYFF